MYIDDCTKGIDMIMHCERLIATPINLGSSHLVSINDLVTMIEDIAGIKMNRTYDLTAPRGVAAATAITRSSARSSTGNRIPLRVGMERTYAWIKQQYADRKAGIYTPAAETGMPSTH